MRLEDGIRFGEHFVVDATSKCDLAVVSHAHSDHVKPHGKILATAATLDLARLNYKRFEAAPMEYHRSIEIGPATVTLAPAGHMLGSAQVIVDWRSERIVYTGDFKLEANMTCPQAEIHKCDILLIDTTYGRPRYKFPSAPECKELLVEFVHKHLQKGVTPVVIAYSFGKAQEAMKMMGDEGIEMDAHQKAYDAARIYINHGVNLKNVNLFCEKPTPGRALIMPPGAMRYVNTYGWGKYKVSFLSGWTLDKSHYGSGFNGYGIPLSDHAGFDDIVRYVEEARPRRVFTLFGPPDIAEYLRRLGFKAETADFNSGYHHTSKTSLNLDLFS